MFPKGFCLWNRFYRLAVKISRIQRSHSGGIPLFRKPAYSGMLSSIRPFRIIPRRSATWRPFRAACCSSIP
ncbi:protein of unknown function [Burkholderia multivorans]